MTRATRRAFIASLLVAASTLAFAQPQNQRPTEFPPVQAVTAQHGMVVAQERGGRSSGVLTIHSGVSRRERAAPGVFTHRKKRLDTSPSEGGRGRKAMSTRDRLARVTEARYVRDHVLWLKFDDGLEGEVDLGDGIWGEVLAPLRDPGEFARAAVQYGTVVWPSGADWAPEDLYERLLASSGVVQRRNGDARDTEAAIAPALPEISRFYGIVILMLANDHAPPQFHVLY